MSEDEVVCIYRRLGNHGNSLDGPAYLLNKNGKLTLNTLAKHHDRISNAIDYMWKIKF